MRRILIAFCIMLLTTACGESKFNSSMEAGKKALIDHDYKKAVNSFDLAAIEKPTDKDALALLDRAKKSYDEQKLAEEKTDFIKEVEVILFDLTSLRSKFEVSTITVEDANALIDEAESLKGKTDSLYRKNINTTYSEVLISARNSAIDVWNAINAIIENIVEPLPVHPKGSSVYSSERDRLKSNDSHIRAELSMKAYESDIELLKSRIDKIKSTIPDQ